MLWGNSQIGQNSEDPDVYGDNESDDLENIFREIKQARKFGATCSDAERRERGCHNFL
jgi:hypothetical protein